jgi:poly(A) polymerase
MTHDPDAQPAHRPNRPLRPSAIDVVKRLVDHGYIAYFAGGCVRDRLLGIEPQDYDIASNATPDQVREVFPHGQGVGESFGVVLVRRGGHTFEVATFRADGEYSDHRRPDQVHFTDAQHDALRRDFTINGMFEDPLAGTIIDYVHGQEDLSQRVIRAIGDPLARINEDRLRMLRAIRFAARFEFSIAPDTADAIRQHAPELVGVSRERIGHEMRRMLTHRNRAVAAWELQYLGLDAPTLDEPGNLNAPTRLGRLPDDIPFPTALAAWALDRDEHAHDRATNLSQAWTTALMLSNDERKSMEHCLLIYHQFQNDWATMGIARQKRLAAKAQFIQALAILQSTDRPRFIEIRRRLSELEESGIAPDPILSGDDLIRLGFSPGPVFKRILEAVYDAQLEGSIQNHEHALRFARIVADELDQD